MIEEGLSMHKMRQYRLILTLIILCGSMLGGCDRDKTSRVSLEAFKQYLEQQYFEVPAKQDQLPDFQYRLLDGKRESLAVNDGSIVLLNFWAVWCFPCKKEMPDLEELKHKMKGEKFRILAINSGDKPSRVKGFLRKFPYSFDVVLDENRDITNQLNVVGLPTTFIMDKKRQVVGKIMGPIDWKDETFVDYLVQFSRM